MFIARYEMSTNILVLCFKAIMNGAQSFIHLPMSLNWKQINEIFTESGAFVQIKSLRSFLNLNLRYLEIRTSNPVTTKF